MVSYRNMGAARIISCSPLGHLTGYFAAGPAVEWSKPLASALVNKNILNEDEANVFWMLKNVRDEVAHEGVGTSVTSASTYSDLAFTLTEKIKKKKQ